VEELPIRIRSLAIAHSSWRTKRARSGAYDVAFDLWTNSSRSTRGEPDGSEIMIWLSSRGRVQPAGTKVAAVRLAGARWQVWKADYCTGG
jgi:Glycosyl hydrolase family 12